MLFHFSVTKANLFGIWEAFWSSPRFSIIHRSELCTMIPLNIRQSEPMSVALATHPVLHCIEEWHWWGYSLYLRHRSKWRWKTGLKKRERANKHIFSDLRNMTIAYIRMIAGAWHSASNWISQPLCPLVITCWAVTWKVLMCGKRARCSRVEVTGVKDPIPLLLSIFEFLFSRDSWGTTCPVVKPNTSLTFSCKSKVVKPM